MTKAEIACMVVRDYGQRDPSLILAIIQQESAFNARAFRPDRNGGSFGLMQLDLPTARDRGYTGDGPGLFDETTNVRLGVAQLEWIASFLRARSAFGLAAEIAAFNEGVGAALRGNPDPRYVGNVLAYRLDWQRALGSGVQ